jgi:hypothetical protein
VVVRDPGLPRVGPCSPPVGRGVALGPLFSPGSMAGALWRATGLTAPLAKFATPDDLALAAWIEAAHGGWVTAEVTGAVVPCLDADGRSAYPAAWSLADWWDVVRAAAIVETDVLAEVQALCRRAAEGDLGVVLKRANYPTLGRTLCRVHPAGEPWPTERHSPRGSRLVIGPVEGDQLHVTAADAVAAAFLGKKMPQLDWARRLDPIGVEQSNPVRIRDGLVVPAGADPIRAIVHLRPPKGGDERLRAVVRVVANAGCWGVFARMDPVKTGGLRSEGPGPRCWPPIAAGVPALARLWLTAVDRWVGDRGGTVIARDTDGIVVVSLPEEAMVALSDDRKARAIPCDEIEGFLARFDQLDPFGDHRGFWDIERGEDDRPHHVVGLAQKRYVKARALGDGWEQIGGTEHALGGGLADPPSLSGRDADRRHRWTKPVAAHALALATAVHLPFRAPWDTADADPFPPLARWSAGSPDALAAVPEVLGAHAFAPLVEARVDRQLAPDVPAPIALDPGNNLAGWSKRAWVDDEGRRVRVSTGEDPGTTTPLARLADVAADWCVPVPPRALGLFHYDHRLARRVGRSGTVVDAQLADPSADAAGYQVVYSEGDAAGYVADMAQRLGPRPFARLTGLPLKVAERAALGRPISASSVEKALQAIADDSQVERRCAVEGCDVPVERPNARYCSRAHADRAYRGRRTSRGPDPYAGVPVCRSCGALMLGAADTGTGLCSDHATGGCP